MSGRRSKPKTRRIVLPEGQRRPLGEAAPPVGSSKHLQELIDLLRRNNLTELELEHQGVRIRLRHELMAKTPVVVHQESVPAIPQQPSHAVSSTTPVPEGTAGFVTVTSPIVGTFYRSPSPDADSYVDEGDFIKKGQVLCIVEAMKLMNEIESEIDGRVVKILVENTKSVEYGQALFLIDPKVTP
ncbi:acetyl-CoA carboxylase biotin carboxyl carrier protein [Nitrospira sp. CMX1]